MSNFPPQWEINDLKSIFGKFGIIGSLKMIKNEKKCICFIGFNNIKKKPEESVDEAIKELKGNKKYADLDP